MTPEERRQFVRTAVDEGLTWMYWEGRTVERRVTLELIRERSETLAIRLSPDLRMLLDEIEGEPPGGTA